MTQKDFLDIIEHFATQHPEATKLEKNCFAYGLLVGRCDFIDWKEEAEKIRKNLELPAAKKRVEKHIAEQFILDLEEK